MLQGLRSLWPEKNTQTIQRKSHLRAWESEPVLQKPEGASAKGRKETKERTLHPVGFLGPPVSKVKI